MDMKSHFQNFTLLGASETHVYFSIRQYIEYDLIDVTWLYFRRIGILISWRDVVWGKYL